MILLLAVLLQGETIIEAGQTLTLTQDLVVPEVFEVRGTAERPCTIVGNGHQILTQPGWKGRIKISWCDVRGLGTPPLHAFDLRAVGKGQITLDHCTFDGS